MDVNTPFRRVILVIAAALGLFIGIWAFLLPESFYSSFPGFGLHWIDQEGAYDEHLLRDVGAMYLAMSGITIAAVFQKPAGAGRLAGLGWTIFGALHLGFHASHGMTEALDEAGSLASLGVALALGLILLLPGRVTKTKEATE